MSTWQHLESSIPIEKDATYRDTLSVVHCDNKLYFFGLKGVDPTSDNWHETMLLGSFVIPYDLDKKKWLEANKFGPVDSDVKHREHLFSVGKHILAFVYSSADAYHKLLKFEDNNWNQEIKLNISDVCCAKDKIKGDASHKFFSTIDGFYVTWEMGGKVQVARLIIDQEQNGTEIKGARCYLVAQFDLQDHFRIGGHLTGLAYSSDHKKLILWGGEQSCGFWWRPNAIFVARLEEGKISEAKPDSSIPDPVPPYAWSGPHTSIQVGNSLVLLGGSTAIGIDKCKDNKEIWYFDIDNGVFKKSATLELPGNLKSHRTSFAFDWAKLDIFACDRDQGVYVTSLKNLN